jgi:hypothetical protein
VRRLRPELELRKKKYWTAEMAGVTRSSNSPVDREGVYTLMSRPLAP